MPMIRSSQEVYDYLKLRSGETREPMSILLDRWLHDALEKANKSKPITLTEIVKKKAKVNRPVKKQPNPPEPKSDTKVIPVKELVAVGNVVHGKPVKHKKRIRILECKICGADVKDWMEHLIQKHPGVGQEPVNPKDRVPSAKTNHPGQSLARSYFV
jgi:transcription elongation factor Elf1